MRPSRLLSAALIAALAASSAYGVTKSGFGAPVFGPSRVFDAHSISGAYVAAVAGAKKTLDVTTYDLSSKDEVAAIVAAAKRGVKVRAIVDTSGSVDASLLSQVKAAHGVTVLERKGSDSSGIMHDKYTVIDAKGVWTGSANLTTGSSMVNVENALLIESTALASDYEADFAQMWAGHFGAAKTKKPPHPSVSVPDGHGGKTAVDVYFSGEEGPAIFPTLASLVAGAKTSVHMIAYELKASAGSQPLVDALALAAKQGVDVRILFDDSSPVQVKANQAALDEVKKAGGEVISWHPGFGLAHSKVIIVDGKTVELGSFNYTEIAASIGGFAGNDENFLIIHDNADVAGAYAANFAATWVKAGGKP